MNIEKELLKLIYKASKKEEIPVAALIVKNGKIISKAYNKRQKSKRVIDHAEVIAILKANKKIKDWRLDKCDMYVSMEPCDMCKKIIEESRIKNVYYYLDKTKCSNSKTNYYKKNNQIEKEYKKIIKQSFKKLRIK